MPFELNSIYHINITVTSIHSHANSGVVSINPLEKVKPDPVRNLTVNPGNSTTVIVSWTPPTRDFGVKYYISYLSQWQAMWMVSLKFLLI